MEKDECGCMKCLTHNPGRDCDCADCAGMPSPEAASCVHGDEGIDSRVPGTNMWSRKGRPIAESKMQFMSMTPAVDVACHMEKTGDDPRWTDMFDGPGSGLYWTYRSKR